MTNISRQNWNKVARSNARVAGGEGQAVSRIGQSVVIAGDSKRQAIATPGTGFVTVEFISESDNYFTAYKYSMKDGEAGETVVYIAKPPHLRRDIYEAHSVATYVDKNTRTVSDGGYTETQQITPAYYVGEIIYTFAGSTGLTFTINEGEPTEEEITATLTEIPWRQWARTN